MIWGFLDISFRVLSDILVSGSTQAKVITFPCSYLTDIKFDVFSTLLYYSPTGSAALNMVFMVDTEYVGNKHPN